MLGLGLELVLIMGLGLWIRGLEFGLITIGLYSSYGLSLGLELWVKVRVRFMVYG